MTEDPPPDPRSTAVTQEARMMKALNIVTKWRKLFAGWQLGTRTDTDPEAAAVRDHREATIILRVEATALTDVLVRKGIITPDEFQAAVEREATQLNHDYAARFPGITASAMGLHLEFPQAAETMKGWRP